MWTLLLWINQKILKINNTLKKTSEKRKRQKEMQNIRSSANYMSDHIKRDMGLPPYNSSNKHDL
jgi:uncharacterized membrane protein